MLKTISNISVWKFLILWLIVANVGFAAHNVVTWSVTLGFFLLVPGYLALKLITEEIKDSTTIFCFSLGLSIFIIMLAGLLLSGLHPLGVGDPLKSINIFCLLDVIVLVLMLVNSRNEINLDKELLPSLNMKQVALIILLSSMPLLAVVGAIRLNNGASGILTMLLFGSLVIIFGKFAYKKNGYGLYPYAIICIGLSVLFTVSLRGWSITGHDIQHEFNVFQLTSKAGYWSVAGSHDTYNACLSITLLPTILERITGIPSAYIYKVVFQVIFAVGLLPIYLFVKKLSDAKKGFIAAFVFISFPTFFNDITMLNRQEIAFIFFSLLLVIAFLDIAKPAKTILTFVCISGLVISHYSSSYIALGLMLLSLIIYKFFTYKYKEIEPLKSFPLVSFHIIIIALLCTFLWNSQITASTSGLKNTLVGSVRGLIDHSSEQSSDVNYSIFNHSAKTPAELLASKTSDDDSVQYAPASTLERTSLGSFVNKFVDINSLNIAARTFCAKIFQLLLLIGTVIVFVRCRKRPTTINVYFLALSVSCIILLALQTILPQVSVDYGTLRFFQQALIVIALPIIISAEYLTLIFRRWSEVALLIFFAFLFLDLSGFLPQLLGGYPGQLSLNNSGPTYDIYYNHEGEFRGVKWLNNVSNKTLSVAADEYSTKKFERISDSKKLNTRQLLDSSSKDYIYTDETNVVNGLYSTSINSVVIEYYYSDKFNKNNLVYSNQSNHIYSPESGN